MFNGYLLKIDDIQVPNNYIIESSYLASSEPIIVSDYYDAEYNWHVNRAPQDQITVSFETRVMDETDYRIFASMIKEEMLVEYYDQFTGTYNTGVFTYSKNITPTIAKINKGTVYFQQQSITLTRKRANL